MSELAKVPFLTNLDPADFDTLIKCMERRNYEAGDLILADGTPGEGLYYVERGTVAVLTSASCDGEIMAHLPAGSTFAETALLNDHPRSSAVRAVTDCTIMVLSRRAFQTFLAEHPAAGQAIQQALLQRQPRGPRQLATELLKPMPLFKDIPDEALVAIARKLKLAQLCADSMVFTEGQPPDALYLIETGKVRLLSSVATGRIPLAELGQHDFFGEDALLTDQPREIAAQITQTANLWVFSRADFDSFINAYPAAALRLTRAFAARSEHINRLLLATATAEPRARPVIASARVVPTPRARPTVVRQPLLSGLRSWVSSLSLGGRVRLALITALLAWLLLVSLPLAIASSLNARSQTSTLTNRAAIAALTTRGGAIVRGPELEMAPAISAEVTDAASAPLVRLSDLVERKTAAPTPATALTAAVAEALTAQPTEAIEEPPMKVTYTVQPGDTLGQIAAEFGLDVYVLAEANNIEDPSLIRVGQELVIPGGEEQAAIAAELAARPRPTATPVPTPAPVAVAAAPAKPALPFIWDGRLDKWNVRLEPAAVAPGQQYFRLVKALFRDTGEPVPANMPGGDHNIYIEVLDENGNRMIGTKVLVRNGGIATLTIENKPFPEYGCNFPMYGMMGSYTAWVDGLPSDKVVGMGLPMKWHVSFFLTFQRTTK